MANGLSWKDAPDEHGGTVRTITGVELNNDTVTAAHLERGFTAHDADGNLVNGRMLPSGSRNQVKLKIGRQTPIELNIQEEKQVRLCLGNTIPMPVNDYTVLLHKPSINDVTLEGNKTGEELGLVSATEKGTPGGVAILDENGKIPVAQIPLDQGDSFPAGGSPGDLLAKRSAEDGDVEWVAPNSNDNYSDLRNKPSINGITLNGNMAGWELGLISDGEKGAPNGIAMLDENGNIPSELIWGSILPGGGSTGEYLSKRSGEDGDVMWTSPNPNDNYQDLLNKPSINGITLNGNITGSELGFIDDLEKGMPNGVAILDENGQVPAEMIPFDQGSSLPAGGHIGDLLTKRSGDDGDAEWIAPATSAEQDNTRPITAAAVYTEIGNINALLATI